MRRQKKLNVPRAAAFILAVVFVLQAVSAAAGTPSQPEMSDYQHTPQFLTTAVPPLVMLVMGRSHKLYYEAYNDASDLDEDGVLDVGYKPAIDYYGYFDCYKCYEYNSGSSRFEPSSTSADKTCSGSSEWSGDFLNYLTMSRMDTMRKVLYGGKRSTDTSSLTVLERAYIPQDAHSWGKEYDPYDTVNPDTYNIEDYTPLSMPAADMRHLFACTTLSDGGDPLLRVLDNSRFHIWEWVSIERPVAGSECNDGTGRGSCTTAGGTYWEIVPEDNFRNLTQTTYDLSAYSTYPYDASQYQAVVDTYAIVANKFGSGAASQINGSGNPFGDDTEYLTIFAGEIYVPTTGDYTFAVDGDDALELWIDGGIVAAWYGGHGRCNCQTHSGTVHLTAGWHPIEYRHNEDSGDDNYYLYWQKTAVSSSMTDYVVRVEVCNSSMPEDSCEQYPDGNYKPVGLLQRHGETDRMYFGLLTGSYEKNTSGGVLRKNIGTFTDEVNENTGEFNYLDSGSVDGIVKTIDLLKIANFSYSNHQYPGGWETDGPMSEGDFPNWGNPVAEMMYEAVRYFAGKGSPTSAFNYSSGIDASLGLPKASWQSPYDTYEWCSKPFMLVLSDINPTYDSDQLPGSAFGSFSGDVSGLDVDSLADTIGSNEGIAGNYYIGESGATDDDSCSEKSANGLDNLRGLCPEEPTKQGSYYSASVAYYGRVNDIYDGDDETQNLTTFSVGLSSPLPRIEIPLGNSKVTLVPFAKSCGGSHGITPSTTDFQPTNTIVDFYVETIEPTYGVFRINYEDVEQGADHDMDAIATYRYRLVDAGGAPVANPADAVGVQVKITSDYAAGSIIQHMGYIISGTTADGTYLEVRDADTDAGSDPDFYLDTPPGKGPADASDTGIWDDNTALPLESDWRTFYPGIGGAASILESPLWYAAKWGAFDNTEGDDIPDDPQEWDDDGDGTPDNYYYVVNPLRLEDELNQTFADILAETGSSTAVSVLATRGEGEGTMVQAFFTPLTTDVNQISWAGYLHSLWVDRFGNIREDSNGNKRLDLDGDNIIQFFLVEDGEEKGKTKVRVYNTSEDNPYDTEDADGEKDLIDITAVWKGGEMLAQREAATRKILTYTGGTAQFAEFDSANDAAIGPLFGVNDNESTADLSYLGADYNDRVKNLIYFMRGEDTQTSTLYKGSYDLRSRNTPEGTVWKLGDIVNSNPVSVAKPMDNYGLLYDDQTYKQYFRKYSHRETVVYVGANDGMLHAFTSGLYNTDNQSFQNVYNVDGYLSEIPENIVGNVEIGSEMWAYIPQNILPHLKWLASPAYDEQQHVDLVDLPPKVVDARVFAADTKHPGGWGTVLIGGMNLGGGEIQAGGQTFKSTYFAIDITNPRDPELMWELDPALFPHLGFTTNQPCVLSVGNKWNNQTKQWTNGTWYVALSSGPTDYDGGSSHHAHLYIVDLTTGAKLRDIELSGTYNSYVNTPVALDKAMNYNVDALYYALNYYNGVEWKSALHKLAIPQDNSEFSPLRTNYDGAASDVTLWSENYLMQLADTPVTAPFSLSVDSSGNAWIFAGTGRYMQQNDKSSTRQNYLFGVKDPFFDYTTDNSTGCYHDYSRLSTSACQIDRSAELYDAGVYGIFSDHVTGLSSGSTYTDLLEEARDAAHAGWYRELCAGALDIEGQCLGIGPSERVINKPAVLGGVLLVPTFAPNDDPCGYGGYGRLFALYFETGTAYRKSVIGQDGNEILDVVPLGEGLSSSFGIHVGQEEGGTAYGQLSTGVIQQIQVIPALRVKSAPVYWKEEQ